MKNCVFSGIIGLLDESANLKFTLNVHCETVVLLSQQKPDDSIEVEIELDEPEYFGMVQGEKERS